MFTITEHAFICRRATVIFLRFYKMIKITMLVYGIQFASYFLIEKKIFGHLPMFNSRCVILLLIIHDSGINLYMFTEHAFICRRATVSLLRF